MAKKRGRFTAQFKKRVALSALRDPDRVPTIASRHEAHPNQVSAWKRQAVEGLEEVFVGPAGKAASDHEKTLRDLHAKIGELTVERDFFLLLTGQTYAVDGGHLMKKRDRMGLDRIS